ncbi:hypothetical protein ACLZX5_14620 [Enterococcus faecium]
MKKLVKLEIVTLVWPTQLISFLSKIKRYSLEYLFYYVQARRSGLFVYKNTHSSEWAILKEE